VYGFCAPLRSLLKGMLIKTSLFFLLFSRKRRKSNLNSFDIRSPTLTTVGKKSANFSRDDRCNSITEQSTIFIIIDTLSTN